MAQLHGLNAELEVTRFSIAPGHMAYRYFMGIPWHPDREYWRGATRLKIGVMDGPRFFGEFRLSQGVSGLDSPFSEAAL